MTVRDTALGHRRVARLMKEENLSVSVKRVCQTTSSFEGPQPWGNRVQNLEVSREDQVWVGDITYVRLNRTLHLCRSAHGCLHSHDKRVASEFQHLTQSLTLKPLEEALCRSVPEIHHSDQGVQYLSNAYLSVLKHARY